MRRFIVQSLGRRCPPPGCASRRRRRPVASESASWAMVASRSLTSGDPVPREGEEDDDEDRRCRRRERPGGGSVLFLSPTNWPEPNASAAGTRTMALLNHFASSQGRRRRNRRPSETTYDTTSSSSHHSISHDDDDDEPTRPPPLFTSVHFGCGAGMGTMPTVVDVGDDDLPMPVHWHRIRPNREDDMVELLTRIEDGHGPLGAVIFDRFHAEETYSFRVRDICPNALLVLDMQDVHSLRRGRQGIVEGADYRRRNDDPPPSATVLTMTRQLSNAVMGYDPATAFPIDDFPSGGRKGRRVGGGGGAADGGSSARHDDAFLREMASVHRSDLVLVCSSTEMRYLESWGVPRLKMIYAPFFCSIDDDDADGNAPSSFGSRRNFAFVGGFRHMPNVDSVRLLRRVLWPMIRQRLPGAILQVCGAHPTPEISSFHDESVGFLVRGMVDDLDSVLRNSRVLLAPLRYGAGIKGKVVDAWMSGLPVVTTRVGAEGMTTTTTDGCDDYGGMRTTIECRGWGGLIEDDALDFAESAIELHEREEVWNRCRDDGVELLRRLFDGGVNLPVVEEGIRDGIANLEKRRKMDVFGSILWRDGSRSTEYFSRWIELKESLVDGATAKRR